MKVIADYAKDDDLRRYVESLCRQRAPTSAELREDLEQDAWLALCEAEPSSTEEAKRVADAAIKRAKRAWLHGEWPTAPRHRALLDVDCGEHKDIPDGRCTKSSVRWALERLKSGVMPIKYGESYTDEWYDVIAILEAG